MSNKVKDIDIKNQTYYFRHNIINIENFDLNNIKKVEESCKIFLVYYIGYVTIRNSKYVKIYSANHLYLISRSQNGCFEEINGSKYLTLVPTNKSKEKIKKYEELWIKTRGLIRSITKNSGDYDEKCIKSNLDDELPLNKTIEILTMTVIVRVIFLENN